MKMWCLSAYPKGIQDVGDFVSSVEHKRRFLTQTVAVCQSYKGSQWDSRLWEKKTTYTDKTKLNPAARDNTLRSKDTKRSVCARNWTVFISYFTSDPPHCPTVLNAVTTAGAWRVFFFLLYGESQTYKSRRRRRRIMVWVKSLSLCSTEETKSPTSRMPLG